LEEKKFQEEIKKINNEITKEAKENGVK